MFDNMPDCSEAMQFPLNFYLKCMHADDTWRAQCAGGTFRLHHFKIYFNHSLLEIPFHTHSHNTEKQTNNVKYTGNMSGTLIIATYGTIAVSALWWRTYLTNLFICIVGYVVICVANAEGKI